MNISIYLCHKSTLKYTLYTYQMNKSREIFAFLMLCTSISVFGQFHTITQQSKFYNIEQVSDHPISGIANSVPEKAPSNKAFVSRSETTTTPVQPISDSLRQQYIDRYLSVSFPLKHLIVNSPFGQRKDPFTGKKINHNGLDLHASGDEVYAMLDGVVKKTGEDRRSGKYIVIQYGDFLVSYCHLSRIWINRGTQVRPGEVVGITGSTGRSTGEHLHITCRRNNKYVDPAILIQYVKEVKENTLKDLCNTM